MRRVSIGVELVGAPDVLVLDEPASGLDSVSAARLVKLLKNLATGDVSKRTIVASIHQHSSALYHSFNQVVLLVDGRQLYFGPGGNKPADFFASQRRPCPVGHNVAEHLLEIASSPIDGLLSGPNAALASDSAPTASGSGSNPSNDELKGSFERRDTADQSDTPFAGKGSSSYPPQSVLKEGGARVVDLVVLGASEKTPWWPMSYCATTFLTQIEVLSGREWRNLKR